MPYRPNHQSPFDETQEPLDARQPGTFRRVYIVIAVIVGIALVVGLLGPLVWRLV